MGDRKMGDSDTEFRACLEGPRGTGAPPVADTGKMPVPHLSRQALRPGLRVRLIIPVPSKRRIGGVEENQRVHGLPMSVATFHVVAGTVIGC
jgi:hypothetical protein